ncbi:MAG: acetoin utilization protein AcuC [Planctomycetota bacterium]|jgi:acetoin utilization protein AcuC
MAPALLIDAASLPVYELGPEHPFATDRLKPLYDLIRRQGLVSEPELLPAPAATDGELALAHDQEYVNFLKKLSAAAEDPELRRRAPAFGLGTADNPIAAGQHQGASAAAGGSLACLRAVLAGEGSAAFNPSGGLHHAMPRAASGFCIYNDLVVAIRAALDAGLSRVAYVDYDVHHGDGVEHAFAEDPRVLTISYHEDPRVRWPGTGYVEDRGQGAGQGSVINLPLLSGTGDESWQHCVETSLRAALDEFRPELLVTQHGCDPHFEDPLADLHLTTASFLFAARLSQELAAEHCGGRWLATGGGGYQPYRVLPRAWSLVWMVMSSREVPGEVDGGWRDAWQAHSPGPLPERFLDAPRPEIAEIGAGNEKTLQRLLASFR